MTEELKYGYPKDFVTMVETHTGKPFCNFMHHMEQMFEGTNIHGVDILDIGFGDGLQVLYLALTSPNSKVFGVDNDKHNVDILNMWLEILELKNVTLMHEDILTYKPLKPFDIVIAKYAIHHLPFNDKFHEDDHNFKNDPENVFLEYLKVLRTIDPMIKVNGTLIIGEVFRNCFLSKLPKVIGRKFRNVRWDTKPSVYDWLVLLNHFDYPDVKLNFMVPYKLMRFNNIWVRMKLWFWFPDTFFICNKRLKNG